MIDAMLPVRPVWEEDLSWAHYVTRLAVGNGLRLAQVVPGGMQGPIGVRPPSVRALQQVEMLSGVSADTQLRGTFFGRYPHLTNPHMIRRRYRDVSCPLCGPDWLVQWHSHLVVVCRRCRSVLNPEDASGREAVPALPDLLEQQDRLHRSLAEGSPQTRAELGRLLSGVRRMAPLLTDQWPPADEASFASRYRVAAIKRIHADPNGWQSPLATAVLSSLMEPHTSSRSDYDRFFATHDPLRAAQIRGWGVWCPRCRNDARITAREGYECVCENCGRLLTDGLGYVEADPDPVLIAASHGYQRAQSSPRHHERQRANRTRLLLQHGRRLMTATWPPTSPAEPAARRPAAIAIRHQRNKGFASSRTVVAALLPACWEAAEHPTLASAFLVNGALAQVPDWPADEVHNRLHPSELLPARARLHHAIRAQALLPEHVPGMLRNDREHLLPPESQHLAGWGLARALYLETIHATTGRRPTFQEAIAAAGTISAAGAAVGSHVTSTVAGLAYLGPHVERLSAEPRHDYVAARAGLASLRRIPVSLLTRLQLRHDGGMGALAAAWIWLDATGGGAGGPHPQRTPRVMRLHERMTPEQRLLLREHGQRLITATADLMAALEVGVIAPPESWRHAT